MPTATIRRRVRNLETVLALALMPDALPFTLSEIESIAASPNGRPDIEGRKASSGAAKPNRRRRV